MHRRAPAGWYTVPCSRKAAGPPAARHGELACTRAYAATGRDGGQTQTIERAIDRLPASGTRSGTRPGPPARARALAAAAARMAHARGEAGPDAGPFVGQTLHSRRQGSDRAATVVRRARRRVLDGRSDDESGFAVEATQPAPCWLEAGCVPQSGRAVVTLLLQGFGVVLAMGKSPSGMNSPDPFP